MKTLDLNNSNLLDSHYSNILSATAMPLPKKPLPRTAIGSGGAIKPTTTTSGSTPHLWSGQIKVNPKISPSATLSPSVQPPSDSPYQSRPIPPVYTQPTNDFPIPYQPPMPPMPIPPIGTGTTGGGGGDAGEKVDENARVGDVTARASADVDKAFYKSFWFWGLVAGGIGGYLFAKSKNKSLLSFSLLGAVGLGAIGYVAEKVINTPATPVTTVPPISTPSDTTTPTQK